MLLTIACDDFLDQTPETFQTPQSFFETEDQINEAVAGIYNTNRGLMNGAHWRFGENRSDNSSFQFNPADRGGINNEEIDLFLMLSANPNLAGQYRDYLLISMKRYQTGERKNAVMAGLVAGFSDKELERLAVFYSQQEGLWDTAIPRFK